MGIVSNLSTADHAEGVYGLTWRRISSAQYRRLALVLQVCGSHPL